MILRLLSRSRHVGPDLSAQAKRGPFLPGDRVDVDLSWPVGQGDGPKDVSLHLVCRETFWYTVKATGAAWVGNYPGHGEENYAGPPYTAAGRPGRYKTSKEVVRSSTNVSLDYRDSDRTTLRGIAGFRLPAGAPPSIRGDTARVEWELWAGPGGTPSPQFTQVGRITVLPGPDGNPALHPASPDSRQAAFEQSIVALSLPEAPVGTGQFLDGALRAKAPIDVHVTKVKAVLECWERAGAKQSSAIWASVDLQGGRSLLRAGQEYQWSFRLPVPDRVLPSASLDETSVVWRVKGILSRALRPQLESVTPVLVRTTA